LLASQQCIFWRVDAFCRLDSAGSVGAIMRRRASGPGIFSLPGESFSGFSGK